VSVADRLLEPTIVTTGAGATTTWLAAIHLV
jgi:hypothetical protein